MLNLRQREKDKIYVFDNDSGKIILEIETLNINSSTVQLGFTAKKRYRIVRENAGAKE